MATENVAIRISAPGAKKAARDIKSVGVSARGAKLSVTKLLGALGGFFAIRGVARLSGDVLDAAASFEQYGIQIGALLGSQREANIALGNFTTLASKTPFAVSEIVQGATALGAAAIGNREKLEELTQTAANLAAVTGISFAETANNLQRSLSAGIAAADLFRDKGVKALIESILGIPDATKLSTAELDAAFQQIFGAGGTFGEAAENLSNTLGGALSNISDEALNVKVALGTAFAPAVVGAAKKVIIPFLVNLQKLIVDNEEEIREFASAFIKKLAPAIVAVVNAVLAMILAFAEVGGFIDGLKGALGQLNINLLESANQFRRVGNIIGLVSDDDLASAENRLIAWRAQLDAFAAETRQGAIDNEKLAETFDKVAEAIGAVAAELEAADLTADLPKPKDVELPTPKKGGATGETPEQIKVREQAQKRIIRLTLQQRVAAAGLVSSYDAQIERLGQQSDELIHQASLAGDLELAREGIAIIDDRILAVRKEQNKEAEKARKLADRERGRKAIGLGKEVQNVIQTRGQSLAGLFEDDLQEIFEESLGSAIKSVKDVVKDTFGEAFKSIDFSQIFGGALSGPGGEFAGNVAGAAFSIGAGLALKELAGTSASARNDLVKGSVDDVQATRGVVAGPTSIPIFQFGQKLEDAMTPTNGILVDILTALQTQPAAAQADGAGGGGSASSDLSLTTPSLA